MREKGGQARPREIYDMIAQRLNLSDEERTVTNRNGYPRFENQIAWARSFLVKTGYLDSPSYGIWRLTDKGKDARFRLVTKPLTAARTSPWLWRRKLRTDVG